MDPGIGWAQVLGGGAWNWLGPGIGWDRELDGPKN